MTYQQYLELFDWSEDALRAAGDWSRPHPWLMTFLPGSTAVDVAEGVLRDLAPAEFGPFGRITLYPFATRGISTPLVRIPDEPEIFTFNLVRSAPHDSERVGEVLEQNGVLYRRVRDAGGKLYPVSAVDLTADDWAEHFGPRWPMLQRAKERFDPRHILTPGYAWSSPAHS